MGPLTTHYPVSPPVEILPRGISRLRIEIILPRPKKIAHLALGNSCGFRPNSKTPNLQKSFFRSAFITHACPTTMFIISVIEKLTKLSRSEVCDAISLGFGHFVSSIFYNIASLLLTNLFLHVCDKKDI